MPIDYSRYPENWLSEIRPIVMHRADNRCEFCGLEHGSMVWSVRFRVRENGRYGLRSIWFRERKDAEREDNGSMKVVKVVLTVAHMDHDEENKEVSIDRLRALCQVCHLRFDIKEKCQRKMIFK